MLQTNYSLLVLLCFCTTITKNYVLIITYTINTTGDIAYLAYLLIHNIYANYTTILYLFWLSMIEITVHYIIITYIHCISIEIFIQRCWLRQVTERKDILICTCIIWKSAIKCVSCLLHFVSFFNCDIPSVTFHPMVQLYQRLQGITWYRSSLRIKSVLHLNDFIVKPGNMNDKLCLGLDKPNVFLWTAVVELKLLLFTHNLSWYFS